MAADDADALANVAGIWIHCGGYRFGPADTTVGIELTIDGHWYTLQRGADGMPTRDGGWRPYDSDVYAVRADGTVLFFSFAVAPEGYLQFGAQGVLLTQPRLLYLVGYPYQPEGLIPWDGNALPGGGDGSDSTIPPTL